MPILLAATKDGYELVVVIDLFFVGLTWDVACLIDFEFHLLQKKYIDLETDQMSLS